VVEESRVANPVVDFSATARRLRRSLIALLCLVLVMWPIVGEMRGVGFAPRLLGELLGWAALVAFVLELVIVGGSAVRGMFRAGARGDRLAADDVRMIPPQLRRRR
jgi:hypothetical protein